MKTGNVVDLTTYQDEIALSEDIALGSMSEELQTAIQALIYRLRELGPITP